MTLEGTVCGGTVILDNGIQIPDGTRVQVIISAEAEAKPNLLSLLEIAGTVNDLPADMALNHDHYLHGHPKR